MLSGTVEIPRLGSVKKVTLLAIAVPAAGYVAWRWWQSSAAYGGAAEDVQVDPGFEDGGTLPSVDGAIRDDNGYGLPGGSGGGSSPTTDDFGFTGTTNDQWTQYAAIQLTQADRWSYQTIVTALGQYLARRPLSDAQVDIVQAAIAVAGYPPQGSYTVIRAGGNVPITVAPSGLRAVATGSGTVRLSWSAVAGAEEYEVLRGGSVVGSPEGTTYTDTGLKPATTYTYTVRAVSLGGEPGPQSAAASAKTLAEARPADPVRPPAVGGKVPPYRVWRISRTGQTLADLVSEYNRRYGTRLTWQQVWDFNVKYRPARTVADLRKRRTGDRVLVYRGSSFWFPK